MSIETATLIAAIITAIIGPIVVYYVTKGKSRLPRKEDIEWEQYGIKIISPESESPVAGDIIEVTVIYSIMPPAETLRLFTTERTDKGERIWPQEVVTEFFPKTKTWRAKANINGLPQTGGRVIAALVGQPTVVLWNYYYKVGPQIGWWDFEGWPNDSVICDRVKIKRA